MKFSTTGQGKGDL